MCPDCPSPRSSDPSVSWHASPEAAGPECSGAGAAPEEGRHAPRHRARLWERSQIVRVVVSVSRRHLQRRHGHDAPAQFLHAPLLTLQHEPVKFRRTVANQLFQVAHKLVDKSLPVHLQVSTRCADEAFFNNTGVRMQAHVITRRFRDQKMWMQYGWAKAAIIRAFV